MGLDAGVLSDAAVLARIIPFALANESLGVFACITRRGARITVGTLATVNAEQGSLTAVLATGAERADDSTPEVGECASGAVSASF